MSESVTGGFGLIYPVLKTMEESGRVRRGYFVAGLGATQFALPGALDLLRSLRDAPDDPEIAVLAATDPANPYGAALAWPKKKPQSPERSQSKDLSAGSADSPVFSGDPGRGPTRSVGATVILVSGALAAYLPRGDRQLLAFLPDAEPDRSRVGRAVARVLIDRARTGGDSPRGMLIEEIDGAPPGRHAMAPLLGEAGFVAGAMGLQATFRRSGGSGGSSGSG
jgi:ATP-dependent Lhr-like helicase